MLKVAIVGCGKIADAHASQIRRVSGCELVAACDAEPLMAEQLCQRYAIPLAFGDLGELLEHAQPHVVHITTPPQSHFALAALCLERGCHVYVEKPFTLTESQARMLVTLAEERRRKITVGHDHQFSHVARRMRELIHTGYLGGPPVHMESYYCYDLAGSEYASALLANPQHWVRQLPGKLLHNVISHGIARIAEYLRGDLLQVITYGYPSPTFATASGHSIIDELRVIIADETNTTAYFTFSSQMRPSLHQFRIYGPKNGLIMDHIQETLITLRGNRMKSYAEKFVPPVQLARQYVRNVAHNLNLFSHNDFHMKAGMKYLIESFYRSIIEDAAVPISYPEILLNCRIMDEIFRQLWETSSASETLPIDSQPAELVK